MSNVNHPSHYNQGSIETIDYILDQDFNFLAGQVVKYLARYRYKGKPVGDLLKADWYLKKLIEVEGEKLADSVHNVTIIPAPRPDGT
ncbi:hypothetical protein LCGC14_0768650 [marine sediment metagenome]|uniref:DUF3310 domain-containing protein n=1 Tax=marine sediment metagenome TaxID=412755 RepID=A0A0F9QIV4_9ZZZZ